MQVGLRKQKRKKTLHNNTYFLALLLGKKKFNYSIIVSLLTDMST